MRRRKYYLAGSSETSKIGWKQQGETWRSSGLTWEYKYSTSVRREQSMVRHDNKGLTRVQTSAAVALLKLLRTNGRDELLAEGAATAEPDARIGDTCEFGARGIVWGPTCELPWMALASLDSLLLLRGEVSRASALTCPPPEAAPATVARVL